MHHFSIFRTLCNNVQIKNRSSQVQQQTLDRLHRPQYEAFEDAEAEIDILEDLEQLNVRTNDAYDDEVDDAFTIIESKSGTKKSSSTEDNVIESFFNDPKKFTKSPPRLQTSAVEPSSFKKFNKLSQKERKKQQQQHLNHLDEKVIESPSIGSTDQKPKWNGWGSNTSPSNMPILASTTFPQQRPRDDGSASPESPSLASIMQNEKKSSSGAAKSNYNSYNRSSSTSQQYQTTQQMGSIITKRTRKPSWKSLSFSDEPMTSPAAAAASIMATSPPNPWKIIPQPQIEQQSEISLHDILREENEQSQNLTRARSKPFNVTQLEETAIQELRTFYNVDSVFDEFITVERVDQGVLATPIWRKRKPSTG